jgi:oxygen-independent coproporphyrinogen-3 oxidase
MTEMICSEISLRKDYLQGAVIETIYFGGGTPSILSNGDTDRIMNEISRNFSLVNAPEVTLEANPEDLSADYVRSLIESGINRLSVGVQSFHDETLISLNRCHNGEQAVAGLVNARNAGIKNLSADIIFGIPGRTAAILKEDLHRIISIGPEHISAYGLTIEEKTVFGKWSATGKFKPASEEDHATEFEYLMEYLPQHGFDQYEISNFAREGYESGHNSSYWKRVPYLGIGPGAHSFDGLNRHINISNNHIYMNSVRSGNPRMATENLEKKDVINEYLMTSLRLREGCDLNFLATKLDYDLRVINKAYLDRLCLQEFAVISSGRLQLIKKGKMIADQITGDLFCV